MSAFFADQPLSSALRPHQTRLFLPAEEKYLYTATHFVESVARASGMPDTEGAAALSLAAEEVFMHLCQTVCPGKPIEFTCVDEGFLVRLECRFSAEDIDFRPFNLAWKASTDSEEDLQQIGLLIAARNVDRFRLRLESGHQIVLLLEKEKMYPCLATDPAPDVCGVSQSSDGPEISHMDADVQAEKSADLRHFPGKDVDLSRQNTPVQGDVRIRVPKPEEITHFARSVWKAFPGKALPAFFSYPGKMADMVANGSFSAALAVDATDRILGGLLWKSGNAQIVEFFGPFTYPVSCNISEQLLEFCINTIARGTAAGMLTTWPVPGFPKASFESLNSSSTAWFRSLREDLGRSIWSHPGFEAYLRAEYERLALSRELRPVTEDKTRLSGYSVLSWEFNRGQSRADLRFIWPGGDLEENLRRHVELLLKENLKRVRITVDVGEAWHVATVPALLALGFAPEMLLPFAGTSDEVIFSRDLHA
ncbi:MAG: hypothetical protein WA705_20170 [Candidatus Ozemobacteraceae bacterium]